MVGLVVEPVAEVVEIPFEEIVDPSVVVVGPVVGLAVEPVAGVVDIPFEELADPVVEIHPDILAEAISQHIVVYLPRLLTQQAPLEEIQK